MHHLTQRHVGEFELILVSMAADTGVVHVHKSTKSTTHEAISVLLPCHGRHSVHVVDLLQSSLLPLPSTHVEVENVDTVEATHDHTLTTGVETRTVKRIRDHTLAKGVLYCAEKGGRHQYICVVHDSTVQGSIHVRGAMRHFCVVVAITSQSAYHVNSFCFSSLVYGKF